MNRLVLLATGWGPQFGGINSFNYDLCRSLAVLLAGRIRITCVVPAGTGDEIEDATRSSVELLPLTVGQTSGSLGPETAHEIAARLAAIGPTPVSAWVGHDLVTGPVAVRMVELMGGQSVLIHHMSYIDYDAFKHGEGRVANDRRNDQRALFSRADHAFGVGPLLRDRLADLLGRSSADTSMLIPGLADIEPLPSPVTFTAISFGRLDPSNDRIKQGRLAIAGFATAVRAAHAQVGSPRMLRDARMTVVGIGAPGGDEERDLHVLAETKADRVVRINALPYDDRRSAIFEHVRTSSVALMLSWHEGFGLTGWEAVAAEVPLIVSLDSGLYRLVDELLGPSGTACLKPLDIRGHFGGTGEENFRPEDEAAVRDALLDLANDLPRWKNAAKRLRTLLSEAADGCTWAQTARSLAGRLGLDAPDVIHPAPATAAPGQPGGLRASGDPPAAQAPLGEASGTRREPAAETGVAVRPLPFVTERSPPIGARLGAGSRDGHDGTAADGPRWCRQDAPHVGSLCAARGRGLEHRIPQPRDRAG